MLTCLLTLCLATLAGATATPSDPYLAIVRLELARSLGGDALASFLERGEPAVAARAALALGRTKKLLAADPLLQHTGASDAGVRAMVIFGLGLLAETVAPQPTSAAATAAPAAAQKKAQVTLDLGGLLGPMVADRRDRAAAAIVAALDDGTDAVKIAALDATGRFATQRDLNATLAGRALDRASRELRANPSPLVRGRAAVAIAALGSSDRFHRRALGALSEAFTHEDDQAARWHVMWALSRGFAKVLDRTLLHAALRDPSEIVTLQALRAIARANDKSWLAELEPLTHDPAWRVNEEARETIATLQGGKRTEHLAAIPEGVVTPSPAPEVPEVAPLPRPRTTGKPSRPALAQLILRPHILPRTVALITGPAPGPHPRVRIVTTKGTIVLALFPEWAPSTVANFLNLTNRGYFDGLRWFRIVPDFVVQTGDPSDNGEGDAGYQIPAEENPLEQDAGVIAMGLNYDKNAPLRDSAGTQFYLTLAPALHLDRDFTVFGRIESGFDVAGRLIESDRMTRVEQLPDVML